MEGRLHGRPAPQDEVLARQLSVSRTLVREALFMLQAEGLIEYSPNRGLTVRSYDIQDLEDAYELRALLEGQAATRGLSSFQVGSSPVTRELRPLRSASRRMTSSSWFARTCTSTTRSWRFRQ